MDTFSDGNLNLAMSSMFVPDAVMSLAIKPAQTKMQNNFAKVSDVGAIRSRAFPPDTPTKTCRRR